MNGEHPLPSTKERDIFLGALDQLSPQDCAAYLERACGDDHALRASVEALLKNYKDDDFLEMIALAARPSDLTTEKLGETIGPYKLLEQIGEGGCGVVYLAEQKMPIHRQVALKVIKLGMDTRDVIARFEAERQVLAMMDHSNIAKVFDAGATKTGRPYFVMELVRGKKITDYCDGYKLTLLQRLDLFVKVCHAVQHAHQNNIIHRDIKPSNILVSEQDGTPMPKVIDFGIAKATTDQQLTDKTLFTAREQFIGTPAYMSPEQAGSSGPEIDNRTDIYSLGVLLYELLVGCLPFALDEFQQNITDDILRTIRENEPPRPSTRLNNRGEKELAKIAQCRQTEPPRLLQLLCGDLDCIVMKCLEKDRTRRYQTANDLAAEIQHYLKDEPITARPPSKLYRFQKMVQRNRLPFAATTIALILILGIIGFRITTSTQVIKKSSNTNEPTAIFTNIQIPPSTSSPSVKKTPLITNASGMATIPRNGNGGPGGTLKITSGSRDFNSVSSANKILTVAPGANLNGTIELQTLNLGISDAIAPLIWTPSWGDHSTSWQQINAWIPTGQSAQQAQVSFTAPTTPGTYHIIFAFEWEMRGDQVASGSSWPLGTDRWNDGNDIAELSAAQISEAQLKGYTEDNWLMPAGDKYSSPHYIHQYVPADALTLIVAGSSSTSATGPTTLQSVSTPTVEGNPQINSVEFRGSAGGYTLTINGRGFGILPRQTLPFHGDTSFFRIAVGAQIGFGEWGFSGDSKALIYESWSDTQVQVAGFVAQPGDAVQIALWNPTSGKGATWGGNVPGGMGTPHIASVTFSGDGQNLHTLVRGKGFGNAPVTMPYTGDLNQFSFGNFRTHCGSSSLFEAGARRWGHGSPNSLALNYQSWSDNEIVTSGFAGSYGQSCNMVQNGDPVIITIWNSSDTGQTGLQTAWGGFVR
jgi:serine/threonine protein kinase